MHVPEALLLITWNRDDNGSQFHGHALCFSSGGRILIEVIFSTQNIQFKHNKAIFQ